MTYILNVKRIVIPSYSHSESEVEPDCMQIRIFSSVGGPLDY